MKTTLIEIRQNGTKETETYTEFDTKYEAERFANIYNETRKYNFVDNDGKTQVLYFYTIPKKYAR